MVGKERQVTRREKPQAGEKAVSTKQRVSEKQAVATDVGKLPFGLHLTHGDIAPPVTFRCRRCETERLWAERECVGCQSQTTAQKRQR